MIPVGLACTSHRLLSKTELVRRLSIFRPAHVAWMLIMVLTCTLMPSLLMAKATTNPRTSCFDQASAKTTDFMHARYYNLNLGRFLSVDPVGGSVGSSQSWNRYSYVSNNPIKFIDPMGLYQWAAGDCGEQCQKDREEFRTQLAANLGSDEEVIRNSALAYGAEGQDNGVTVGFGGVPVDADGVTAPYLQGTYEENGAGTGMEIRADVTIRSGLTGTSMRAAVGHEGVHVADAQAFAASFSADMRSSNQSLQLTHRQTESNACRVTHRILSREGGDVRRNYGCKGCTLGGPRLTPTQVNRIINRILTNPTGSYLPILDQPQLPYQENRKEPRC